MNLLPQNVRRIFSEDSIPTVTEEIGYLLTPRQKLDVDGLQGCVNHICPGFDYVVEKGDPLESSVRHLPIIPFARTAYARTTSFRHVIANVAFAKANQPTLDAMLNRYGRRGTEQYLPTESLPGNNPIGVLALVYATVRSLTWF